jgi:radical SAM protein with 4Fe4S-binding SPASM domain
MRPFPDVVRIEPAGICNFRCTHCPVGREGGKRGILSFANFVRIFDGLPAVPRVLVLYHGGEPLLNRELELMISYAKDNGVSKIVFNTNASLISDKRDLSKVDELRVSFDGDSQQENDSIRVNSAFHKHAANVRRLSYSTKRPKVIKIYNARHGTNEAAPYLLDYFRNCEVIFEGIKIRKWARTSNEPKETNGVTSCSNLFDTFTILSDGSVPMCCEDLQGDAIVGNIFQNSAYELWEGMEELRKNFAAKKYPRLCQSCWVTTRKL